ncbi:hypothetical protein [Streptomyces sp. NBC_00996]|uniref:hypothetical protein n=1 Tax=Streptomyces sp. NBC_00996 TaxID=2903710 RepID=UPI00386A6D0B|nr:hypothetical protein OG390_45680 [Streptomyces sp. NBC_00996]
MPDTRGGRSRLIGGAAALLLFAAPLPAAARTETPAPRTVPALSDWEAVQAMKPSQLIAQSRP